VTPRGSMSALVLRLVRDPRVRYLVVGGSNTVVGFAAYAVALALVGHSNYWIALLISHSIGTTLAFVLYRRFVFLVSGRIFADYLRFQMVYLGALSLNIFFLFVFVQLLQADPLASQGGLLALIAALTYLAHKFFSFRRPRSTGA